MIKFEAPETKSGRIRYAEANGRRFRITRQWETRTWYEVDEIIDGAASYAGPARLLSGVKELLERITSATRWTDPRGRTAGDILIVAFPEADFRFRRGDEVKILEVAQLTGFPTLANYRVIRHPTRPASSGHWIPSDYFQTN